MSASDRFREFDSEPSAWDVHNLWVAQKDARAAEFHSTVGRRTLRLMQQFGIASRRRYTEPGAVDFERTYVTELYSRARDFKPEYGISGARVRILREIHTLPSPLPLIALSRKAAGYALRAGTGEITGVTIDYVATPRAPIHSVTLDRSTYRESTPLQSDGYVSHNISDEATVSKFTDLLADIELQLEREQK